jgi:hypothetical protein
MQFPASHSADKIVMYSGGNEKIGTEANTLLFTADNYKFKDTNGDDNLFMNNSGQVGIGTTTPDSYNAAGRNLVVADSGDSGISIVAGTSSDSSIMFADGTGGTAGYRGRVAYDHNGDYLRFDTAAAERMRIDSSGNCGIGTSSPESKLHIEGLAPTIILHDTDTSISNGQSYGAIQWHTADGSMPGTDDIGAEIKAIDTAGYGDRAAILFSTAEDATALTERMRIASGGNVGIGTTSPSSSLHINTTNDGSVKFTRDGGSAFSIEHDTSQLYFYNRTINEAVFLMSHSGPVVINQGGDDAVDFRVEGDTDTHLIFTDASADRVGIGASSPKTKLDVENSTAPTLSNDTHAGEAIFLRSGGSSGDGNVQAVLAFGKADGSSRRSGSAIASVQTDSDADKIGVGFYTSDSSASSQTMDLRMLLNHTGNLHVDADVVAFSTSVSDEKLKDNVKTISNPLDKVMALRGVEFDWNKGNRKGQKDLGLIAQEVEKVLPEIVREKKMAFIDNETYKTIDYDKVVGLLIEAIKEQQEQINKLEDKLNG